ncbi:phage tail tape measure protein [Bifidobacterium sp.]|uniref:phage tail tape measure protein n=1 Tax=Bifidobacterium sp. TaxID=41200 RepID=UPI0039E8D254
MAGKAAWVDVLPNMSMFAKALTAGTNSAALSAGRSAGRTFSAAMNSSSASDILKSQVDSMKAALEKAENAATQATRNIAQARSKEKTADLEVAAAEAKVTEQTERYGAESSQALKAQAQLTNAQSKAAKAADVYSDAQKEIAAASKVKAEATESLAAKETEYSAAVSKQPTALEKVSTSMTGASKSTGLFKNALSSAKGMITAFGVTAGAVSLVSWVKGSLSAAEDFQKQMNLLVTAGGESQKALGLVSAGIKSIATQTGISTSQLSEGMYTMEKAQIRGANGLKVLKAAAQGATDEQVDLGVMTNALTSIMRSYNLPASKATSVTNQLVAASGAAKTTMSDFAGSLSTVLPVASAAGLSFSQVGGAIATLTSHGTSADEATQELSNTIRALQAPNAVAVKEMQQFGISSVDVAKNLGKNGLTGTISYLTQSILKNMGPSGTVLLKTFNQSSYAAQAAQTAYNNLGGDAKKLATEYRNGTLTLGDYRKELKELPATQANLAAQWVVMQNRSKGFNDQLKSGLSSNQTYTDALKKIMGGATGMNTALMLSGGSTKTFANNVSAISKAAKQSGSDISTWAETQNTAKVQTQRFNQELNVTRISLASKFLPAITSTMRGLTNAGLALASFTTKHTTLVKVLGIGAASLLGLVAGFKLLRGALLLTQGIQIALATATKGEVITQDAATISAASYATAQGIGNAMAIAGSAAMTALGAAIDFATGPIGLIIIGITALVAGFVLAYKNSATFRGIVTGALNGVKSAASAVGRWFSGSFVGFFRSAGSGIKSGFTATVAWFSGPFANFFVSGFHLVENGAKALWNGIKTVGNGILNVFRFLVTMTTTILVTPWVIAFNLLKAPVLALWHNIISPAFNGIKSVFLAYLNWVKGVFVTGWNVAVKGLGVMFTWLYKSVIIPVLSGMKTAALTFWNWYLAKIITPLRQVILDVENASIYFWKNVIVPVLNGIKTVSLTFWNWLKASIFDMWNAAIRGVGATFKWLYTSVIQPVWNAIKSVSSTVWNWINNSVFAPFKVGISAIGTAFDKTASFIKTAWNKVKEAAATPVRWVVNTVYTNGIEKVWNKVAKAVGLKLALPDAPKFTTGGVMPGYTPGRDVMYAHVSGGEAIMRPEFTRAVGAGEINRLNAIARTQGVSGVRQAVGGYANGGVIPSFSLGGVLSSAWGSVKDVASNIWSDAKSAATIVKEFISDPGSAITNWIVNPVKNDIKGIGAGDWGSIVAQLPLQTAKQLISKATSLYSSLTASTASSSSSTGGQISYSASAGVKQWDSDILSALSQLGQPSSWLGTVERRMNQESGGNPNAINNWDSNAKAGIPSQGLMQVIPPTFAAYAGPYAGKSILDPMANIYAGLNYALHRYGSLSALNQAGGYANGGVIPTKLYDTGGWLPTGSTLVENHTSSPELILNRKQQDLLFTRGSSSSQVSNQMLKQGGDVNIEVNVSGAEDPYTKGTTLGRVMASAYRTSMMGV